MKRTPAAVPAPWPSPFPVDVAFRQAHGAEAAQDALLPEERALLSPQAAASRVVDFALGRRCAREALAALEPGRAAEVLATPLLRVGERRPAWPPGFVGSITHHRGMAAAAAARAADYLGLGLDLEAVRAPSPALVRRILRPEEREAWEAISAPTPAEAGQARAEAFMRIFSAKESLFKALNPHAGVYLGFQDAAIAEQPPPTGAPEPQARTLRWRLHADAGPGFPAGREGVGGTLTAAGFVLAAVWIRRPRDDG